MISWISLTRRGGCAPNPCRSISSIRLPERLWKHAARLTPERCLKAACLFRLLNPRSEVRAAGGRELNLGERQADLFNAVNSIFVNGYLTTAGWGIGATRELIEGAGFEVEVEPPATA